MNTFQKRNRINIELMTNDCALKTLSKKWFIAGLRYEYLHHFSWLGLPIIQAPQDIIAMQEIVWKTKPDLIIETGIARGGSLILYASLLELIGRNGQVIGIDIDIRRLNRKNIEAHPLFKRITMIEGSSIEPRIINRVCKLTTGKKSILVILDSNHTHDHVLKELKAYSPMVTKNNYLVVFDTVIANIPDEYCLNRPWSKNNNPKTAIREFLKANKRFTIDQSIEKKLLVTAAPGGFLKCVR